MFDFEISTQTHFDEACRKFAATHNLTELAERAAVRVQTLRNKLNPDQKHKLTVDEVLLLTDLTEDATLIDGMLAQLNCLPCVPVNEVAEGNYSTYVMKATAELGVLASKAFGGSKISANCRRGIVEAANTGVRCMMLAAIAIQTRIHSNPTLASTVDAISGIGATVGLS